LSNGSLNSYGFTREGLAPEGGADTGTSPVPGLAGARPPRSCRWRRNSTTRDEAFPVASAARRPAAFHHKSTTASKGTKKSMVTPSPAASPDPGKGDGAPAASQKFLLGGPGLPVRKRRDRWRR